MATPVGWAVSVLSGVVAMTVPLGTSVAGAGSAGAQGVGKSEFELHVVVDFYDDLLACPFTRQTLREMMRIFRSWGVTRVYWVGRW